DVVNGAITFNERQAALAEWISERYVCELAAAVRLIAPAALTSRVVTRAHLADARLTPAAAGNSSIQASILAALVKSEGAAPLEELRAQVNASSFSTAYAALLRKGLVVETRETARPRTIARTVRGYDVGSANCDGTCTTSKAGKRVLDALAELRSRNEL